MESVLHFFLFQIIQHASFFDNAKIPQYLGLPTMGPDPNTTSLNILKYKDDRLIHDDLGESLLLTIIGINHRVLRIFEAPPHGALVLYVHEDIEIILFSYHRIKYLVNMPTSYFIKLDYLLDIKRLKNTASINRCLQYSCSKI